MTCRARRRRRAPMANGPLCGMADGTRMQSDGDRTVVQLEECLDVLRAWSGDRRWSTTPVVDNQTRNSAEGLETAAAWAFPVMLPVVLTRVVHVVKIRPHDHMLPVVLTRVVNGVSGRFRSCTVRSDEERLRLVAQRQLPLALRADVRKQLVPLFLRETSHGHSTTTWLCAAESSQCDARTFVLHCCCLSVRGTHAVSYAE